ncbi:MAG: hypothetical protein ACYDHT_02635 [Solirubrobacteraceae bacterium]
MTDSDNSFQLKARPARGYPAEEPPGFAIPEGTSPLLVGAEKLGRFLRIERLREALAHRRAKRYAG